MGYSLRRGIRDFGRATGMGPLTELADKRTVTSIGRDLGLSPGKLPQDPYQSPDPYGGDVQWDESGMPTGRMPRGQYALDYQYEANRRAEQRRNALWGDAQNTMRQAADLFQSYRPGGSAALAANVYGQKANLYGTQAQTIEAPDLLMGYREHQQDLANRDRKRQERFARTMGLLNLGVAAAGAAAGAGGGMPPLSLSYAPGGQQAPMGAQNAQGQTMMGPGWGTDAPPPQGPGLVGGPNAPGVQQYVGPMAAPNGGFDVQGFGQAMQSHYRLRQGGAGAPGGGGPQGGSGGDMPQPGVSGGQPGASGGQQGGGQAGGDMPGGQGMPGGGQPLVEFSAREAASNAMGGSPMVAPVVEASWAEDEARRRSTYLMMSASRRRLVSALDW